MKKIIIAFAALFIGTAAIAQIGKIEPQQKEFEFIGKGNSKILHRFAENTFKLMISSTNEYETKCVHIELGKSPKECIESLGNLYTASKNKEAEFPINGYKCFTNKNGGLISFYHIGDLEFAAGNYVISDGTIRDLIKEILLKFPNDTDKPIFKDAKLHSVANYTLSIYLQYSNYNFTDFYMFSFPFDKTKKETAQKAITTAPGNTFTQSEWETFVQLVRDGLLKEEQSNDFLKVIGQ